MSFLQVLPFFLFYLSFLSSFEQPSTSNVGTLYDILFEGDASDHTPYHGHDHKPRFHDSYVDEKNYYLFWDKGTFPTVEASIHYHTRKHGYGRTPLQYTRAAVNFYERNKRFRYSTILMDGIPGYRIKKEREGGIWTRDGKILTYWD